MKIWKFALIAAVAGFIHGVTSSEPPYASLQEAAVSITRLPVVWWANRMANPSDLAFSNHKSAVATCTRSEGTTSTSSAGQGEAENTRFRVPDAGTNMPTDRKSDSATKGSMAGVLLTENGLSVDATSLNLSNLLDHLSEKCNFEIVGKDALSDKVISAKFDFMRVEDGIRGLMRIAGVENYALTYRTDPEGHHAVSQIVFMPRDNEVSDDYRIAKARQEADSKMPDHRKADSLGNVAPEVPDEILADVQAAIKAEVPAEMQAAILAETLAELRE